MDFTEIFRKNKKSVILTVILTVLPFITISVMITTAVKYESEIFLFNDYQKILLYTALSFTLFAGITPSTVSSILTGYFLGWLGMAYMLPAYMVAALAGYILAKFIDKGSFLDSIVKDPKANGLYEGLKKNEWLVILFSRLSPVLPFAMTNFVLSVLGAKIVNYLTGSLCGMLPRTLLCIWVGMQISDIRNSTSVNNVYYSLISIGLAVISFAGLYLLVKKSIKEYL